MLHIKHTPHIDFPHMTFHTPHPMQLSPVVVDDADELTVDILNDPVTHDNNWELTERPDDHEMAQAIAAWDQIIEDVHSDPEWFKETEESMFA